jgi:ATP-binding cassette subfamily F protein 3
MALNEFEGTVMLVSHDRALLRAVCDEFWMVSRGGVSPFDGDLDDYQRYLLDEAKRQREEAKRPAPATAVSPQPTANATRAVKGLRRELDRIEGEIAALNAERDELQCQMAGPPSAAEIARIGKRLKTIQADLVPLEERWLALSEQIEAADAPANL